MMTPDEVLDIFRDEYNAQISRRMSPDYAYLKAMRKAREAAQSERMDRELPHSHVFIGGLCRCGKEIKSAADNVVK